MGKNILLARANIRKAKGQTVAIVIIVLLSSMMMNLWLMLSMDYRKNFDRCHDRLNDGHFNIAAYSAGDDLEKFISDILENRSDVTGFSVAEAFAAPVSFEYNGGEVSSIGVLLEKDEALSRNTGRFEITEDSDIKSGIYLPMIYGTGNNFSVGDTVKMQLFGEECEFDVCGFFNSAMCGSHNCSMLSFLLTKDKFDEFSEKSFAVPSFYISARVKDISRAEEICGEVKDALLKEYPNSVAASNHYEMISTSRYVSQMICSGIMSAMAFLVLLIGVVVISSNIANYIQENMQNLGALKAVGYTSGQLISALLAQFVGVSAAASVIGIMLSYLVFPSINGMMVAQTGIPYEVTFQSVPLLLTMLFIAVIVSAAVYITAKKIKKIEPIMALRQGIATHNFKKNRIPLENTSLPVNAALAVKTTLSGIKMNITVCVTMLVISLIAVFSATVFSNVVTDMQMMIEMIAGEYADSAINVNPDREEELIAALGKDSRVEKYYLFTTSSMEVRHSGGDSLYVSVVDDCSKLNNRTMFIEGRYPKYENEMAIAAKYAMDSNIKVGDEIALKMGSREEKYIVSGFTQNANTLGKDCVMTREGFERIGELPDVTYYVDIEEDADVDKFNEDLSDIFGSDLNSAQNVRSIIGATGGVYVSLMTVLVIAIMLISCVVIIFVMYLLVRSMLNRKKRDYGILKALGFTTSQLVFQTALSFMPAVIISVAAGIFASIPLINPLLALFLSGIGIVKGTFAVPVGMSILFGILLIVFAFAAACLMSLKIKKIAPRELLIGE